MDSLEALRNDLEEGIRRQLGLDADPESASRSSERAFPDGSRTAELIIKDAIVESASQVALALRFALEKVREDVLAVAGLPRYPQSPLVVDVEVEAGGNAPLPLITPEWTIIPDQAEAAASPPRMILRPAVSCGGWAWAAVREGNGVVLDPRALGIGLVGWSDKGIEGAELKKGDLTVPLRCTRLTASGIDGATLDIPGYGTVPWAWFVGSRSVDHDPSRWWRLTIDPTLKGCSIQTLTELIANAGKSGNGNLLCNLVLYGGSDQHANETIAGSGDQLLDPKRVLCIESRATNEVVPRVSIRDSLFGQPFPIAETQGDGLEPDWEAVRMERPPGSEGDGVDVTPRHRWRGSSDESDDDYLARAPMAMRRRTPLTAQDWEDAICNALPGVPLASVLVRPDSILVDQEWTTGLLLAYRCGGPLAIAEQVGRAVLSDVRAVVDRLRPLGTAVEVAPPRYMRCKVHISKPADVIRSPRTYDLESQRLRAVLGLPRRPGEDAVEIEPAESLESLLVTFDEAFLAGDERNAEALVRSFVANHVNPGLSVSSRRSVIEKIKVDFTVSGLADAGAETSLRYRTLPYPTEARFVEPTEQRP